MSDWQMMISAPRDGTEVILKVGRQSFPARFDGPYETDSGEDGWAWTATTDTHPKDWTDGVCWSKNDSLRKSRRPDAWRHKPSPPS